MSARARRAALIVFSLTVLIAVSVGYGLYRYGLRYPDRSIEKSGRPVTVTIARGSNFSEVVRLLEGAGLVRHPFAFRIFVNYKGLAAKVRAGTYKLTTSITPRELIDTLVHGVPAPQVAVTVAEGKHMLEVADILASAGISQRDTLARAMRDVRLLRRLGVPAQTAEGFLFPDTYKFRASTAPAEVLRVMVKRHKQVYHALRAKYPASLNRLRKVLGWGHKEIVTMASIVEKETGQKSERPLIAGVFINRMTLGSFRPKVLATDPTIVYGCTVAEHKSAACQTFKDRIRRIHLDDVDNPYNTYKHTGLPPGPIANPGRAAIEAVFAPKKSRYLYFVSKNDGTHYFSSSRAQHERAVDYYQRGRGSPPP